MTQPRKPAVAQGARQRQIALRRFKAEVFQALAHPTRIHIAECLEDGEQPVGVLIERLGIEPANLSQHLAVLRAKGLVVNARRERRSSTRSATRC
jgi:DNA-binding transcriptional ArsR family regulator